MTPKTQDNDQASASLSLPRGLMIALFSLAFGSGGTYLVVHSINFDIATPAQAQQPVVHQTISDDVRRLIVEEAVAKANVNCQAMLNSHREWLGERLGNIDKTLDRIDKRTDRLEQDRRPR